MIIECAHCHARYQYDAARFEGKASKKIRCAKCQQVFEIHNPDMKAASPTATVAIPRPQVPEPPKPATPVQTQRPAAPAATPPPKPTPAPAPPTAPKTTPGRTSTPSVGAEQLDMTMRGRPRTVEEPLPEPEPASVAAAPAEGAPRLPSGRRLSLAIIDGPDSGKVFRIEKPKVVIGRSGADLNLNDNEASRNHAAVEIRDTVIVLQDLGSTNGTLLEGTRIDGQAEIMNQSEFQVGLTTLMLIVTDDEAPASR